MSVSLIKVYAKDNKKINATYVRLRTLMPAARISWSLRAISIVSGRVLNLCRRRRSLFRSLFQVQPIDKQQTVDVRSAGRQS